MAGELWERSCYLAGVRKSTQISLDRVQFYLNVPEIRGDDV